MSEKIKLRLDALAAADSLFDFWPPYSGPERCHRLKGDLAGTYSMDVKQPYRLLFKPAEIEHDDHDADADNKQADEKQTWLSIREVDILGVEDTHD